MISFSNITQEEKACKCLLKAEGICKTFGKNEVLHNIDFDIRQGEVHAIIGENGAGKSTLLKIMFGVHQATKGRLLIGEREHKINNPAEAKKFGIAMINQEPMVFEDLNILENIFMGHIKTSEGGFVNNKLMANKAKEILDVLGINIDLNDRMSELSIAQKQMIEIASAMSSDAKIIFMDEPTASLTPDEVNNLFKLIKQLKNEGRSIVYISHRLEEIKQIADRVTILRDGELVGHYGIDELNVDDMITLMIGSKIDGFKCRECNIDEENPYFEVRDLSSKGAFTDVSFTVRKGEIIGVSGLMGSGRTEIAQTIFGIRKRSNGEILINGKYVKINNPSKAIKHGIALVPEDRKSLGVFFEQSISFNSTFASPKRITKKLGFISKLQERKLSEEYVSRLSTKYINLKQHVEDLSGGNQQKVCLAKWLLTEPNVLILDEPTRGIDIGAKQEVYKIITELADAGKCIIMISSELNEILTLSDKAVVMYEGRQMTTLNKDMITEFNLLSAAHGYTDKVVGV